MLSFLAFDDLPAGAPRQVALGHSPSPVRHDDRDGEDRRDHSVEPPVPGRAIKGRLSGKAALEGLQSAAGFLRRMVARTLTTRTVPTLHFVLDRGFEHAQRVDQLLAEIKREEETS